MTEILLTSSVLILTLLILRRLFRRTVSRRVQYALWGLVLLRLLVPFSLPAAEFSLLTAAEPMVENTEALYVRAGRETVRGQDGAPVMGPPSAPFFAVGPATEDNTYTFQSRDSLGSPVVVQADYQRQFRLEDVLSPVWYGGMAVMAVWLILSNLLFWKKLRRHRVPYAVEGARLPVYLAETGLPSPCLFGLLRPAVYLTPAAVASPESLRHVLAHEEAHARHLDPLWSLLRGVCLVVFWFDPLVWWAALASRTDCELACDEGALRRLGEAERVPYGRTLLALIPVRKAPANPLLSATTMTSDKKRLMDRITRIAENRKTLGAALFAVISLAALVCAVTFTGAKASPEKPRPLTQEELDYFNGEFFTEAYGQGENRRRQFLTSVYDSPQSIDLYELLYNGTGLPETISEEERRDLEELYGPELSLSVSYIKISKVNIETFLLENTGVAFQDTYRGSLDRFWWMLAYESYYHSFPDSPASSYYDTRRYLEPVTFTSGTREGDTVRLLYEGEFYSDSTDYTTLSRGPLCLTLREKPEGGWWFVSNEWDLTDRTPAAPDWEPIITIPLDGLEPYEPKAPEMVPFAYDYLEMLDSPEDPSHILGDYCLLFFRNGEGRVFAGVQNMLLSSWPPAFWSFVPGQSGTWSTSFFRDLMGHDGFCITITDSEGPFYRRNDYYYLNEDGQPVHLARVDGWPELIDLDGDGQKELVSQAFYAGEFYFARDGKHYRADLDELLRPFWPEDTLFTCDSWDAASRSLPFQAWTHAYSSIAGASHREYRTLYFDGENLLVYNDQRHFDGHMSGWFDEYPEVKEAALEAVRQEFDAAGASYDDWRVTDIDGARVLELAGQSYRVWRVSCEFHSQELQDMPGTNAQDRWADPFGPERLYLIFRDDSQDEFHTNLTYLFSMRQYLWPTEAQLPERLAQAADIPNAAAVQAQAVLDTIMKKNTVTITLLASEGGGSYKADPQIWSDRAAEFTEHYNWSYAEDPGDMPATSLLLMDGSNSFRFWPDSDLVLLHTYQEDTWLRAEPTPPGTPHIFYPIRTWYLIAAGSSVPIQETLEKILAGAAAFVFTSPEGIETRAADIGRFSRIESFTGDYQWTFAPDAYTRSPITLEISSQDGSFTFSPYNALVKLQLPGEDAYWFSVPPDARGGYIYDLVYGWYEAAE